jgi:hypothetical protein
MKTTIFKKFCPALVRIVLLAAGYWFFLKMGFEPFGAVLALLAIKGILRFTGCLLRIIPFSLIIAVLLIHLLFRI